MTVKTLSINFSTDGNGDVVDVTDKVAEAVTESGLSDGIVTIFSPSATSALTTIEYEAGCIADLQHLFELIAPVNQDYVHNKRWGDGNGHSHVRAALLGPSLTIPFISRQLTLGKG